jgi:hypothetical protein
MAKFITNTSKGVICLGAKNFIPGAEAIEVTAEEAAHPMIAAYISAGKLALTEITETTASAAKASKKASE